MTKTQANPIPEQFLDLYTSVLAYGSGQLPEPYRTVISQVIGAMAPLASSLLISERAARAVEAAKPSAPGILGDGGAQEKAPLKAVEG